MKFMARKISSQCGLGFRTKHRPKGAFCCSFLLQLCIIMATIGLASCQTQNRSIGNGFKSLSVSAYEKAISRKDVVRLDVRTSAEFAEGHIENAINIDVLKSDFEEKATAVLPKDKTIAVNCRSGKRSKTAAGILVKNGYKVIELAEGYTGWTNAGKKVVRQ